MTNTVTITHHQTKPEYQWELVIPDGPTIMLPKDRLAAAMEVLGLAPNNDVRSQIEALPNGESRSVDADLEKPQMDKLLALSVKTV